jgi:hypothetical protein
MPIFLCWQTDRPSSSLPYMPQDHSFRPAVLALSRDLRLLFDQTVSLAGAEIKTAVRSTLLYVAVAAGAVVIVICGLLVLVSTLVLIVIALGLPPWASAGLVGFLLVGVGAGIAYFCLTKLRQGEFDLRHTRHSVKETLEWLKAQATN